uniref:Putative ixostatin n=1 Tax=Ixodes ricinus TaxID=34613 RepID=A0A0K8RIG5_IXORI
MIRMMLLPLSIVLLASSGHVHAQWVQLNPNPDTCSKGLGNYINTICSSLKAKLTSFSGCSFTCEGKNDHDQTTITKRYLMDGLPCGLCMECCTGVCTPVQFGFENPLTLKSCAKKRTATGLYQ